MRLVRSIGLAVVAVVAMALAYQTGRASNEAGRPPRIVGVYGVGGVIGEDGTLWQYMPDRKKWLTIDAAFDGEGRQTHILPLPVPAGDIQYMQSWGFLVTRAGACWHFDLNTDRWENVGLPPATR